MTSVPVASAKAMLLPAPTLPLIVTDPLWPICSIPLPDRLPARIRLPPASDSVPLSTMLPLIATSVVEARDLPASMVMLPAAAMAVPISMELLPSTVMEAG